MVMVLLIWFMVFGLSSACHICQRVPAGTYHKNPICLLWCYKVLPSMPYGCNPFCFTRYLYHTTYSGERKEDLKKTVLFSAAWQGYINPLSKIFLPGTRHSPDSPTRIIFTRHTAQERPPKKSPDNFCSPFSKNASEKFDFRPNRNISGGNFRKGVQKQTGFDFFCAVCQVFFVCFTFSAPSPRAPAKK